VKAHVDREGIHFDNENLISKLEWGNYVATLVKERELKTIDEYRAEYFAKRDILANDTGNSKKDVHEEAKKRFLDGSSTTSLSLEEWVEFINKFKEWSFEYFNCYL